MVLYSYKGDEIVVNDSNPNTDVTNAINDDFADNMELDYEYDSESNVNYTILRVFQTKRDGTKQYPFVRSAGRMSALDLSAIEDWDLIINSGLGVSEQQPIDGVVIEDGKVVYNSPATHHKGSMPLTIDKNGNLGYADANATGEELLAKGIVNAVCGFCPIIIDYKPTESFPTVSNVSHFTQNAQRQIIGQFGNGDYAILTCEGRNFDNSDGWTLAEAQKICQKHGLKFAYNLDGGGSTQTVLHKKQINTVYENTTGRKIPTFIVFNGTTTFGDKSEKNTEANITVNTVTKYESGKTLKYDDGGFSNSNIIESDSIYTLGLTDYIDVSDATEIILSAMTNTAHSISYVYYDGNKNIIYAGDGENDGLNEDATNKFIKDYKVPINTNAKYIRAIFWKNDKITWEHPFIKVTQSTGGSNEIQTIHFTQTINKHVINSFSNTLTKQDGNTPYTDSGVLFLPSNYKEDGEKTRLVIACHGSGTVIDKNFNIDSKKYVKALVYSGYAVLDVNGGVSDGRHFGAPFAVQSYIKAYNWAVKNYNLYDEVFVFGASMGGLSSFGIVQSGAIPVIAQGATCPVVDLLRQAWMKPWFSDGGDYGIQRERIAEYYNFENYNNFDSGSAQLATQSDMQYFIDNADKVKGYYPMINKSINGNVILTTDISDYAGLYDGLIKFHTVPLKIWHGQDDKVVAFEFSEYITKAINNSGGIAYLRPFMSDEHTPDLGNIVTMQDIKGETFNTNVSNYELIEWFKRWE